MRVYQLIRDLAIAASGVFTVGTEIDWLIADLPNRGSISMIGVGLAIIWLAFAWQAESRSLRLVAAVCLGLAVVGVGLEEVFDARPLLGAGMGIVGIAIIGGGLALHVDMRVFYGVALIVGGVSGIYVGLLDILSVIFFPYGVLDIGLGAAAISHGVVTLRRAGYVDHVRSWLGGLVRDPSSDEDRLQPCPTALD